MARPIEGRGWTYIVNGGTYPDGVNTGETLLDNVVMQSCIWSGYSWRCSSLKERLVGGEYGYSAGGTTSGGTYLSSIEKMIFSLSSGTTSVVGNLVNSTTSSSGFNSSIYSYLTGNGVASSSQIHRFSHALLGDSVVSNTAFAMYYPMCLNSSVFGYSCGGNGATLYSGVDRILFAADSLGASKMGNLSQSKYTGGTANSTAYGYILGGSSGVPYFSTMDRFTFPLDSGNAAKVGNLIGNSRSCGAGFNSTQYAFSAGGEYNTAGGVWSSIERIVYPNDSGDSTVVGNMSMSKSTTNANNSTTYGYVYGGAVATALSSIEYVLFPFNSGTSTASFTLSSPRTSSACSDNTDFVAQFV